MPRVIRALLADDEPIVRVGVNAILGSDEGIEVVAEAADGAQAVEQARRVRPDVALLDVRMPGLDGLAAASEIRRIVPETAVIILTTFGESSYIQRALTGGASGFLLKTSGPRELISAVRAVAGGAAYLSPWVAKYVISQMPNDRISRAARARERVARLTGRERDVLGLLGQGLSNAEIAARLHLVEGTVKGYVSTILQRLNVENRVQAAILAYEAGLVER
ncbi:two component transcriptional regulator, LuxR family [Thermomonospora curvata DSM 43183]|uniref:Two component transcriptional regulator, LuxR family n=1 Tax=Thermomonospora curvata (strain ATCC 19995 / DSM 43183 / JCM 3096 / KCTC 9072 / NBRC 15933 / NCIMB 10081 / Henssen B9) TaxID=471852 RepID=D1A593_THECD|nr:two component transcriptional regulator, LuxR family [Thermomonospora curvata DSM 43183]